jgi:DNA polymerase (family 10)
MGLEVATKYAEQIARVLSPYAYRIEIAGSIRRRRPECHDVDLVIIPRDRMALEKRALLNAQGLEWGGAIFRVMTKIGVQLDLYYAHQGVNDMFAPRPSNWGTVLLCRTGSAQHNIALCEAAKARGLHWNPQHGVMDAEGRCVACETEEAVFAALGMEFVKPEDRER